MQNHLGVLKNQCLFGRKNQPWAIPPSLVLMGALQQQVVRGRERVSQGEEGPILVSEQRAQPLPMEG